MDTHIHAHRDLQMSMKIRQIEFVFRCVELFGALWGGGVGGGVVFCEASAYLALLEQVAGVAVAAAPASAVIDSDLLYYSLFCFIEEGNLFCLCRSLCTLSTRGGGVGHGA